MTALWAEIADVAGQLWRGDYGRATWANAWRQLHATLPIILFWV